VISLTLPESKRGDANARVESLPRGWKRIALGELVTKMANGIVGKQTKDGVGLPVSRIETISHGVVDLDRVGFLNGVTAEDAQRFRLLPGDILFSHINSDIHLGKTAVFSLPDTLLLHGMNLMLIRVKNEVLNSKFLHLQLNFLRFAGHFVSIAQHAVNQSSINQAKLKAVPILLPPLEEQQRIVAEIEKQFTRLDAGVASTKRVQTALKRYRACVLKAACEGPWPQTTVAEVAGNVRYGTSAKTTENADGVPVLRMGNIFGGRLSFEKLKYLPASHDEFPDLLLEPGDLLFNRTNSAELVGKTAVYHGIPKPCSFASYLIRARVCPDYNPDFLSYYLNSVHGRQWIATVVSQQVGQANVNGSKLKALEIPKPPLAEQNRIVTETERRLSVVEELEAVVTANLQRAKVLRQSILHRAFSQKLPASGSSKGEK
jgi:type I restriction enzyme S subunit